jgi:hypothetical protein
MLLRNKAKVRSPRLCCHHQWCPQFTGPSEENGITALWQVPHSHTGEKTPLARHCCPAKGHLNVQTQSCAGTRNDPGPLACKDTKHRGQRSPRWLSQRAVRARVKERSHHGEASKHGLHSLWIEQSSRGSSRDKAGVRDKEAPLRGKDQMA